MPPFEAEIKDGYIYGRGTIDMKNMAAMSAVVMKLIKESGITPEREIIFAAVADEETGCEKGSEWLVENHPEKVRAEYGLGELGGFTLYMNGRTLYPIQVAEKGMCWIKATAHGEPGHGSVIRDDNAVVRLSEFVSKVGRTRLPLHISGIVERSFHEMAEAQPQPAKTVLPLIMKKRLSSLVTDVLVPDKGVGRVFASLIRNTANPTVLRAGSKTNVVPSKAEVELDGRIALGSSRQELLAELRDLAGPDVQLDVIKSSPPCETDPDTELYALLSRIVAEHDPGAMAVPYVIPGFTDAKSWTKLGIKCYGFSPVRFDPTHDIKFADLYHGHNERIPVDGFQFGLKMLADAVFRFCCR
jgi:acetylornithine deacetylase/succinyl-diaminopimelate desuccinylase-like protein